MRHIHRTARDPAAGSLSESFNRWIAVSVRLKDFANGLSTVAT
jgi:hypothetical protein